LQEERNASQKEDEETNLSYGDWSLDEEIKEDQSRINRRDPIFTKDGCSRGEESSFEEKEVFQEITYDKNEELAFQEHSMEERISDTIWKQSVIKKQVIKVKKFHWKKNNDDVDIIEESKENKKEYKDSKK